MLVDDEGPTFSSGMARADKRILQLDRAAVRYVGT